mgnify:CR=1 FL=1
MMDITKILMMIANPVWVNVPHVPIILSVWVVLNPYTYFLHVLLVLQDISSTLPKIVNNAWVTVPHVPIILCVWVVLNEYTYFLLAPQTQREEIISIRTLNVIVLMDIILIYMMFVSLVIKPVINVTSISVMSVMLIESIFQDW